ncbi:uncharacterized protein F4822DRAFT_425241 [Hypoxylon trugodes]|uniref:uncharacterized protein n=1 Tax=Hypoxylon trugodes TaxID=326681 RepID=UPI002196EF05|nr:uncharacterized protein F4822DRAFT_425241 [Hypoxylon trugodes]KAI1392023.1 hypothetical protein F4822DRAFT_425241 [Hypoxylon trugodes]
MDCRRQHHEGLPSPPSPSRMASCSSTVAYNVDKGVENIPAADENDLLNPVTRSAKKRRRRSSDSNRSSSKKPKKNIRLRQLRPEEISNAQQHQTASPIKQFLQLELTQLQRFIFDQVRFPPDNPNFVLDYLQLIRQLHRSEDLHHLENKQRQINYTESDSHTESNSGSEMAKVGPKDKLYLNILDANCIKELRHANYQKLAPDFIKELLKKLNPSNAENKARRRQNHPTWYPKDEYEESAKKFEIFDKKSDLVDASSEDGVGAFVYAALALDEAKCDTCDNAMESASNKSFKRVFLEHFPEGEQLTCPRPDLYFGYSTTEFLDGEPFIPKIWRGASTEIYQLYCQMSGALRICCPYLIVEAKPDGGSESEAEKQCVVGCSTTLAALHFAFPQEEEFVVFGLTLLPTRAQLSVAWRTLDNGEAKYYFGNLKMFSLKEKEPFIECREYIRAIHDWGVGERKNQMKKLIKEAKKGPPRYLEPKKGTATASSRKRAGSPKASVSKKHTSMVTRPVVNSVDNEASPSKQIHQTLPYLEDAEADSDYGDAEDGQTVKKDGIEAVKEDNN